jgi:A/G-specific adenine glycosylase
MLLDPVDIHLFQSTIFDRYTIHKRDLPWRETLNPYAIMVSEVMSQQTQISRVILKRHQWMRDFPDITTLASSSLLDVLAHWSGL